MEIARRLNLYAMLCGPVWAWGTKRIVPEKDVVDIGLTLNSMRDDPTLFDGYYVEMPPALVPEPKLSPTRQRTLRQHKLVAAGIHPLVRLPAKPELGTCGTCGWRQLKPGGSRSYPKCTRFPACITSGAATDCRAWWPACSHWKPKSTEGVTA